MKAAMCRGLVALLLFGIVPAHSAQRNDGPTPYPSGLVCISSVMVLNYVEQPLVQAELKLTPTQQSQLDRLHTRLTEAEALAWAGTRFEVERAIELSDDGVRLLGRILTPEQSARHSQIVLQHLVSKFGLVQIVDLLDVVVVLDPDPPQSQQVKTILETIGYGATNPGASGVGRGRRGAGFGAGGFAGGAIPPGMPARRGFRNPQAVAPQAGNVPVPERMPNAAAGRRGGAAALGAPDEASRVAQRRAAAQARTRERLFVEFTNPDLTDSPGSPAWEAYAAANVEISGLFKTEQKQRLLAALGTPLAFQPAGSPPAVIRRGTSLLAFPRFASRPPGGRSFEIGTTTVLEQSLLAGLLSSNEVLQELRLTNEQKLRFPPLTENPDDAPVLAKLASQLLAQEQFERLRQLTLQSVHRQYGPSVVMEFKEIADTLRLSDSQRNAVNKLLQAERQSIGQRVLSAVEQNPVLRPALDRTASNLLAAILTSEQQVQVEQLLGMPFEGVLPSAPHTRGQPVRRSLRSRVAPSLGYLTSLPEEFLESRPVQQALRLSNDQRFGAREPLATFGGRFGRGPGTRIPVPTDRPVEVSLLKRLTPEQEQRYFQIVLRGSVISSGPAAPLRYRRVIDALAPTPEQREKLLEVLWHDTRRYLGTSLAELTDQLPELDRQTTSELTLNLNSEQRQTLSRLLEDPADSVDAGSDAEPPSPALPVAEPSRAVPMRRMNYAVRHGSAIELAEILRERYPDADGAAIVPAQGSNRLLIAAPEAAFDEITGSLEELDRPRQTFVVDLILVEGTAFNPGTTQVSDAGQFTGTIEEVTSRLDELLQEQKISRLRKIRFEVGEERTGSAHYGRESMTITPNVTGRLRQGGSPPGFRMLPAEMSAAIKVRMAGPGKVAVELTLDDTRIAVLDDADELDIGPGGPMIPRDTLNSQLASQLTIPIGGAAPAQGLQTDGKSDGIGLRVIVAARLAESASP